MSTMPLAHSRNRLLALLPTKERDHILAALDRNTYNMAATARELGVSRVTLYRLAQRLAIDPRGSRTGSHAGRHGARSHF